MFITFPKTSGSQQPFIPHHSSFLEQVHVNNTVNNDIASTSSCSLPRPSAKHSRPTQAQPHATRSHPYLFGPSRMQFSTVRRKLGVESLMMPKPLSWASPTPNTPISPIDLMRWESPDVSMSRCLKSDPLQSTASWEMAQGSRLVRPGAEEFRSHVETSELQDASRSLTHSGPSNHYEKHV